jgi:hypothetical protein
MHKHYAERAEHRAFHARYATGTAWSATPGVPACDSAGGEAVVRPEEQSADALRLLAGFGTATVCEAAGGEGIVDVDLKQVIPGSRAAGPARTVLCGQGDNLAVHEALPRSGRGRCW